MLYIFYWSRSYKSEGCNIPTDLYVKLWLFIVICNHVLQFCKRFRAGKRCCEFECLDEPDPTGGFLADAPINNAFSIAFSPAGTLLLIAAVILCKVQWDSHKGCKVRQFLLCSYFTIDFSLIYEYCECLFLYFECVILLEVHDSEQALIGGHKEKWVYLHGMWDQTF